MRAVWRVVKYLSEGRECALSNASRKGTQRTIHWRRWFTAVRGVEWGKYNRASSFLVMVLGLMVVFLR